MNSINNLSNLVFLAVIYIFYKKVNTMDIEARKIAMVKQILNIENERLIKELEAKLITHSLIAKSLMEVWVIQYYVIRS